MSDVRGRKEKDCVKDERVGSQVQRLVCMQEWRFEQNRN